MPRRHARSKSPAALKATPPATPEPHADEPPLTPLLRVVVVMVGALLLALSPGSRMRVEYHCAKDALLETTRFCERPVGRRIQICGTLIAAVMLFDIVLVAFFKLAQVAVALARAACRAPAVFADVASEALVEWRRCRKEAQRRKRRALRDAAADRERRAERKREAEATWRRARERKARVECKASSVSGAQRGATHHGQACPC